ncbi:class II glutamine amidotransferase [Bosea sp. 124]|uniref:class II glutamine amidotransferase n=1 Tax=Bosea sp. 124 TaxID=2135642 RepID=UPI000D35C45E|nr:class II glutamine amidotransferase [Bosea sp. 124]
MCELLGLSSNLPSTLTLSLRKLAEHGGPPFSIRDGWGVGFYEGSDVRLIKDSAAVDDSEWLRFVDGHDLRSHIIVSHIRKATMGERSYANAQPFIRELAGRTHLFAHNGWLPGIMESVAFRTSRYRRIGETDSEQAFCALLERLRDAWDRAREVPPLDVRLAIISTYAAALRQLGPANFLYSDGDTLFAHGDRRKNAVTGKVSPPGLVFLRRECVQGTQADLGQALSIGGANQAVTLVASTPLSNDAWEIVAEGEIIALSKGEVVRLPSTST